MKKTWGCKIGEVDAEKVPDGGDSPMRRAIEKAYKEITGENPTFLFSGWGEKLTDTEKEVVEETQWINDDLNGDIRPKK